MRWLLFFLPCTSSISCLYPGTPIPLEMLSSNSEEYYPSLPGSKWVYEEPNLDKRTWVLYDTAVTHDDGTNLHDIMKEGEHGLVPYEQLLVTSRGLFLMRLAGEAVERPVCLLKLPNRPGELWENQIPEQGKYTDMKSGQPQVMTNMGIELVKVPAGLFWAIRIDCQDPVERHLSCASPWSGFSTKWYAPGVGLVKYAVDGKTRYHLKSFSPGKPSSGKS